MWAVFKRSETFFLYPKKNSKIQNSIESGHLFFITWRGLVNSRLRWWKVTFFFSGNKMNHSTKYMENRNNVTEFVLLGLTQNPTLQKVIFVVFLVIYIISVVGNIPKSLGNISWEVLRPSCSLWWPMTAMWPSASPCTIQASWTGGCVGC